MKVILDLDAGIDDGMALAYATGNSDIELIGVTGTYGNVYTEDGVQNALNLLHLLKRDDVPVFVGESHAINKDTFKRQKVSARIHGENGVGQVSIDKSKREKESMSAVDFMIQSIKKHKDELVIIATGPMTNLAVALTKAPEIKDDLKKVVIMGGALTVPGNVSAYAEANISQDPLAAKILFESGVQVTMVGLDVTQRSELTKKDTEEWRKTNTIVGKTYADMVDYYIAQHEHSNGKACFLHDPSAVICAVHPEYFTILPMHMTVVTEGEGIGRTIGDSQKLRDPNPNTFVCIGADRKKVEHELNQVLLRKFQNL